LKILQPTVGKSC